MTTYYTDPINGNDINSGLIGAPFKTIQRAANEVDEGDTVLCKDGIYPCTTPKINIANGGNEVEPVIFKSINRWGAKIDGKNTNNLGSFVITADYVTIDGFEIMNQYWQGIITESNTSHNTIKHNRIHHIGNWHWNGDMGAFATNGIIPGGSNHIIDSNMIHDVGKTGWDGNYGCWDHAIYGTGEGHTVINNVFYDIMTGSALDIGWDNGIICNNTIARFRNPTEGQIDVNSIPVTITNYIKENIIIQNNLFMPYNCKPNNYVNYLLWTAWDMEGVWMKNNLKYSPLCPNWTNDEPTNWNIQFSDNIVLDPKFVNISTRDLHLQLGSPAIKAGLMTNAPLYDFDGNPRIGHNDIGAYQYTGTTTCPNLLTELKITKI